MDSVYVCYSFDVKMMSRVKNFICIVFSVKFCVRLVPVSHYVVQWFRRNGHFDDIEAVWGWIGWWIVGGHFYHGRVGSIFNVSRHFSYPRDAKFCEEYDSKGLVLITSL